MACGSCHCYGVCSAIKVKINCFVTISRPENRNILLRGRDDGIVVQREVHKTDLYHCKLRWISPYSNFFQLRGMLVHAILINSPAGTLGKYVAFEIILNSLLSSVNADVLLPRHRRPGV